MKTNKSNRLTKEEIEFIQYFGPMVQKFKAPFLAKVFGVSKQAVQYQIDKSKK